MYNTNAAGTVLTIGPSGLTTFATGRVLSASNAIPKPGFICQVPGQYGAGMWLDMASSQLAFGSADGAANPITNMVLINFVGGYLNLPSWNTAYKNGGGTWTDNSDARIKRNIEDYKASVAEIVQLRPITYEYNGLGEMPDTGTRYHGFIAQEAVLAMPEMVGTRNAKLDPKDADETALLTVNVTPLIFALVNAVKELSARIDAIQQPAQGA